MNPKTAEFLVPVEEVADLAHALDTRHRTSGGEITGEEKSAWLRMRNILEGQEDVHRLIALDYDADAMRWWYLIETPFATFPRFVIGHADPENLEPIVEFQSAAEWSAQHAWITAIKDIGTFRRILLTPIPEWE